MRHAVLIAALLACGSAAAQAPAYDPDQMPEFRGKVEAYKLNQRDELDGFFLEDGVEVHLSTRLSSELARAVHPGDAVTIHGLRSQDGQMVQAFSIANDASGLKVSDAVQSVIVPGQQGYRQPIPHVLEATGRIKRLLHGVEGEFAGVLLDDGTNVRLAQGMTGQNLSCLVPGKEIAATGTDYAGALGKVIETRALSLITTVPGSTAGPQRCIVIPNGQPGVACRC